MSEHLVQTLVAGLGKYPLKHWSHDPAIAHWAQLGSERVYNEMGRARRGHYWL